jgi:hypothetical protein
MKAFDVILADENFEYLHNEFSANTSDVWLTLS